MFLVHQAQIENPSLVPDELYSVWMPLASAGSDPHSLPEWSSKLESQEKQKEGARESLVRSSLILR